MRLLVDFGTPMQQLLTDMMRSSPQPDPYLARVLAAFPGAEGPLLTVTPARQGADALVVDALTPREQDVLTLLASRLTDNEIAGALRISIWTVKRHTSNIYQKLHVESRREAVSRAQMLGFLPRSRPGAPP